VVLPDPFRCPAAVGTRFRVSIGVSFEGPTGLPVRFLSGMMAMSQRVPWVAGTGFKIPEKQGSENRNDQRKTAVTLAVTAGHGVERRRVELPTSSLRTKRSTS
jgi:hypothetical protein